LARWDCGNETLGAENDPIRGNRSKGKVRRPWIRANSGPALCDPWHKPHRLKPIPGPARSVQPSKGKSQDRAGRSLTCNRLRATITAGTRARPGRCADGSVPAAARSRAGATAIEARAPPPGTSSMGPDRLEEPPPPGHPSGPECRRRLPPGLPWGPRPRSLQHPRPRPLQPDSTARASGRVGAPPGRAESASTPARASRPRRVCGGSSGGSWRIAAASNGPGRPHGERGGACRQVAAPAGFSGRERRGGGSSGNGAALSLHALKPTVRHGQGIAHPSGHAAASSSASASAITASSNLPAYRHGPSL